MAAVTHDIDVRAGLPLALISAASFALSGALARGLIDQGWSPGAVVLARIAVAATVIAPFAARALRGRTSVLRRNLRLVAIYGAVPVAGTQFAYFSAVAAMDVGPALLIEYTAPAAIVVWLWLRHGERPSAATLAGAGVAALGLVLVLDLVSGADLALEGVLWALAAMVGAATYFVLSADTGNGLPPLALAGGGLAFGSLALAVLGVAGVLPLRASTASPVYAGHAVAWWLPFVGLGVITAAIAYSTGIAASRRLGSRLASFVALLEVVAAVLFAWLLLDQLPAAVQLAGGVLIVAGVVLVKLGEPAAAPAPAAPHHEGAEPRERVTTG
ncbi:MAG TPA: DMT family transporter [Solirubrobacteraceae bacterium]|nr:DMT family transporter [Solirubrobacteraceae bacterium]